MAERHAVLNLLRGGSGRPPIENAGMPREVDLDIDSSSGVERLLTEQRVSGTAGSCACGTKTRPFCKVRCSTRPA